MTSVQISIITPTYNSAQYIESCIQNVINQNCEHVEHIIIDGASTDGTIEIIKHYANQYSHIRWISEADSGQSNAMNKGIKLAKGTWIGFLNVDDYYESNVLHNFISKYFTSKHKLIVGNCNMWDNNEQLLYVSKPKDNTFCSCYFRETYPVNPSSYFYKKSIHSKIGFFNENDHYCMDLDFLLRYMNHFKSYLYVNEIWGNFRVIDTCKTAMDKAQGNMISRKKDLFKYYWKQNSFLTRYWCIFKNKLKSHKI